MQKSTQLPEQGTMHIMTVLGARPQFVKAAMVSNAIAVDKTMRETLLHTGQHFDANMSEVFFRELGIPAPAFNLHVRQRRHGGMTGHMLDGIEAILVETRPDVVLVYGDTNSTLAGALAAAKLQIPVAHVEAGLRSFNRRMPEEINRVLTDHVSDALFAPTPAAVRNLANENIAGDHVHLVGDVMYDAVLHFRERARQQSGIADRLQLGERSYVLCTIHRAENTNDPAILRSIFAALASLARIIPVVLPLHPRTLSMLVADGIEMLAHPGLQLIEPVGYLDMMQLEASAALIVTDSGGVQKEAYFHRVPCVTLRRETEWVELVEAGWNRLVPPDEPEAILAAVQDAIGSIGRDEAIYGNGDAASRIVDILKAL
jgi:UDP-GlcNAc3NAcA epimerase